MKTEPYYPHKKVSYGNVFFFIKTKTFNINPFDKEAIADAKREILVEAKKVSPSYRDFVKAATKATGLSESRIADLIKPKRKS